MIRVAILVVLVIIAIVIAPWLIAVAAVLAAAYGIYLVIAAALAVAVLVIAVTWVQITGKARQVKIPEAKEQTPEQKQEQHRRIEAAISARNAKQKQRHEQTAKTTRTEIQGERKVCKFCQVEIAASVSHCNNCGNSST